MATLSVLVGQKIRAQSRSLFFPRQQPTKTTHPPTATFPKEPPFVSRHPLSFSLRIDRSRAPRASHRRALFWSTPHHTAPHCTTRHHTAQLTPNIRFSAYQTTETASSPRSRPRCQTGHRRGRKRREREGRSRWQRCASGLRRRRGRNSWSSTPSRPGRTQRTGGG